MAYKEPKEKFGNPKPQPEPDWTHIFEDKSNKMYDKKVRRAAKLAPADGYMNSGTDKTRFGM